MPRVYPTRPRTAALIACLAALAPARPTGAADLDPKLHHLRAGATREWADFPAEAEGPALTVRFQSRANDAERALRLRQQDVKQAWRVLLNGKELGRLTTDENDTVIFLPVPAGRLVEGENVLRVEPAGAVPADDVRVGEIALDDRPVSAVLAEATVEVTVREARPGGESAPVPCRITVVDGRGALMTTGAVSTDRLAVRPGVIYTADGTARFGLPAGDYTVYAGRGFEYGTDSARLALKPGDSARKTLTIRREVPTDGWAACDTHVHTLTHSGHGDATDLERAVTIAGEGLELPIATEHNKQVSYHDAAVRAGVRDHFTPVVGNEVTTAVGHFNIFPVKPDGPVPEYRVKDWKALFAGVEKSGAGVVVLNHPRDLHLGFRPFGPGRHLTVTGASLDGWELRANAVEVVNSGAQQTDVMRLVRDWFGLLNRGLFLTPVGSSDSHDVSRFIVGQGRTYVRCKDDRPGAIDVEEAVRSLKAGRVLVSCGLLVDFTVGGKHGPGDLAPVSGDVEVSARVLGPGWAEADRVELYANGVRVRSEAIRDGGRAGVKWSGTWTLPRPRHDVHLVAVASGPGVEGLFWPIAKPYQPTSPVVRKRVVAVTGAVWLDADGDGQRTSAYEYARRLDRAAGGRWAEVVKSLAGYDEAVAAQAAGLLQAAGVEVAGREVREAARQAGPAVEAGFDAFAEAWREAKLTRP
jgi:hypothetical protein